MIFLLCDFGKINLKNLQKLQKLDISGDDYIRASGLRKGHNISFDIHDQITHKAIPPYVKKYLDDNKNVSYKRDIKKLNYLPISNPINQAKNKRGSVEYNQALERLAARVEGKGRKKFKYSLAEPLDTVGNSIRKRNLTKVEKLATNMQTLPVVNNLMTTKRKPTQSDVASLIKEVKQNAYDRRGIITQQLPKQRGSKVKPQTVEEKKSIMRQKYGK